MLSFVESPENDLDSSSHKHDDMHQVSGISPFQSAEDIQVSLNAPVATTATTANVCF